MEKTRALPLTTSYWPADRSYQIENDLTVGKLLERAAAQAPDRVALVDGLRDPAARRRWTYAELLEEARSVARTLLDRFEPGERILILAPNSARWVVLQLGAGLAGLVLATANPAYQEREIEYVLRKSAAAGVFLADEYRGHDLLATVTRLAKDIPSVRTILRFSEWEDFLAAGRPDVELPVVDAASPAQIQYTGGTTGFPKGVLLHHRGICNTPNLVLTQCGMELGDVWLNAMPLFHVGGCVTACLGIVARQGTHVVAPEFEPGLVLELMESERVNMGLFVPTMLIRLLDHPRFAERDMSSVHTLVSGAAPVPAELIRRTKAAFGCSFTNIYGQTEVSGVVTTTRVDDTPEDQSETIGRPVKQVEIKIADPVDGSIVPLGVEGEICGRGHQMMIGYLDDPETTRLTLDEEGWLHTGDLGSMDERGYLRITGRLKDMIIRGGENISPREVEDVLFEHPDVAEAVVLGIPDDELGEVVAAVVRTVPSSTVTPSDLQQYCRNKIARFKAPSVWFFVDAYPTTAAGKIQKFALRDSIMGGSLAPTAPKA
ncbi:AMP-binding protein [Prauserella flavalba]|uniref:AMP-dependent synthetase n=1 Tax=Prauserella flavalba TaxID=1477506 RepID=A0A318LGD0_9PSEU|nr:AMP-binding protein [Prauserella flavalba]PXY18447.1 AMP-dependent synthetase [Prauserella flavalba]